MEDRDRETERETERESMCACWCVKEGSWIPPIEHREYTKHDNDDIHLRASNSFDCFLSIYALVWNFISVPPRMKMETPHLTTHAN